MPRPAAFLVLALLALAGCGGRAPRPARPADAASIPALLGAADSAAARGAREEARDEYARAAEGARHAGLRDEEFRAEMNAGLLSIDLGESDAARKFLARALELRPQSAEAHDGMGRLHAATRRYADAKAEFDRAAALDTLTALPLYHLGQAYAQAGDSARAAQSFARALQRDPNHVPTQEALSGVLDARFRAAGLPEGYAALRAHSSVSRGELGVMLAAELGADPERPSWRGAERRSDTGEARGAWGERWLRESMARGWIEPFPDGSFHLGDPVTRGALALLVARIAGPGTPSPYDDFPDLGRRHYLARAAGEAAAIGLPTRAGRFEASASATGAETLACVKGLAKRLGVEPVTGEEQRPGGMVK